MMAGTGSLTLTKLAGPSTIGDRWETVYQAVGDTSYVDNGYPLLRTSLGFAATPDPEFHVEIENTMGYGSAYDYTNQKLLLYASAGTAIAGAATAAALTDMRIRATGKYKP